MRHPMCALASALLGAGLGGLAHPAAAGEGVIEINQTRAMVGGVTAGDTPGFPITISRLGSYRLTSNLAVGNKAVTAIDVTTSHVTIDLNGFSIGCSAPGFICIAGSGGMGIDASGQSHVTVRNGSVVGHGGIGISAGESARIEGVHAVDNANDGISAGPSSTLTGNTASDNAQDGIAAGDGSTVIANTTRNNGGAGIFVGGGSTVTANSASFNDRCGLLLSPSVGYAQNVLTNNNGGDANRQVYLGLQIGTNLCGNSTACPGAGSAFNCP